MKKPAAQSKSAAYPSLITGIGTLLEESRRSVARAANCFMTATYWEIGRRIVEFEQGGKRRAEYGEELLARLSRDLTERHGRGFSGTNLKKYRQFFLLNPNIRPTLSGKSAESFELETSSLVLQKTEPVRNHDEGRPSHLRVLEAGFAVEKRCDEGVFFFELIDFWVVFENERSPS